MHTFIRRDWSRYSHEELASVFSETFGAIASAVPSIEVETVARCASLWECEVSVVLVSFNDDWSVYYVCGAASHYYLAVGSHDQGTVDLLRSVTPVELSALGVPIGSAAQPPRATDQETRR